ncbi:MAG TPA: glycosyltransferase family 2 protein [Elusimicrobiota bacterium]|nr:glycosyltransferase family 2 protein [Elusimicrobiota bacterium]
MPEPGRLGLSVVVPVYNEEESLRPFAEELSEVLSGISQSREVILVDDGSKDGSYAVIEEVCRKLPDFKAVRLGRNAGQTAALSAGIARARGELIVCLDADGQNDPHDIPAMLAKIEEGYDVVSGWRKNRKDPWLSRRLPSQIANGIISSITGVPLHDYGCTLKIYRARYLKEMPLYGEMHRFIPAFAGFLGARIAEVEVHHRPRTRGSSKYGISRTFKVILDLLTVKFMDAYLAKPIYLFGGGGVIMGLIGAVLAAVTLYKKLALGVFVKDQPLFMVSIFFAIVGFQLILLGLLAEILIRIYFDIKGKPAYFVRETLGFLDSPGASKLESV